MGAAIGSYRSGGVLFVTAPALWIAAALLELLQHAVEWHLGMFTLGDGIDAGSEHRIRMGFGMAKAAAILACTYLVPRFLYQERDWQAVRRLDKTFFKGIVVAAGLFSLVPLFLEAPDALARTAFDFEPDVVIAWSLGIGLALSVPLMALQPWVIGLFAGDHAMTLRVSIRAMHRRWIWATFLLYACVTPTMILHYALNGLAVGKPPLVLGSLLVLDSVLVGFIALTLGTASSEHLPPSRDVSATAEMNVRSPAWHRPVDR